jgi:hypothetical protein
MMCKFPELKEGPMKARVSGFCVAGVVAFALGASAQGGGQPPSQPQTSQGTPASADKQITVTGCVQREADYRQAKDAGRGGAAGTGVGAGNEFVLTDASPASSAARKDEPPGATGTSGGGAAKAYEVTGPGESQLGQYVGRRVEVTGRIKAAETTAGGQPTGGATAGQPPKGVDVTSKDLKLSELEVISVREAQGACPAK